MNFVLGMMLGQMLGRGKISHGEAVTPSQEVLDNRKKVLEFVRNNPGSTATIIAKELGLEQTRVVGYLIKGLKENLYRKSIDANGCSIYFAF